MTWRGRFTIAAMLASVAGVVLALHPGRVDWTALESWLEAPGSLRLPPVSAAPSLPGPPPSLLRAAPTTREAFDRMQGPDPTPAAGERLETEVAIPDGLEGRLLGPLRVEYTLDAKLTQEIWKILRRSRIGLGHVVIMDPETGKLLAYVSTDADRFPPDRPYPAASLIKVVTAAAALDREPSVEGRTCRFVGSPYRLTRSRVDPPRGGNEVTLTKALATSNNQCFAQLAVHTVGAPSMIAGIRRFGFLEPPAPAHAPGRVDDPGADSYALGKLGSGLAGTRITPLHAVRLAGVIATGELVNPRWVDAVYDGAGRPLPMPVLSRPREVLAPALGSKLRRMLIETTRRGTARRAFRGRGGRPLLGDVRVAGKTGSLSGRDPDGRYEWFVGVAPAEKPRIAVAVVAVQGALWWRNATQVSAEVFQTLFCEGRKECGNDRLERWLPVRPQLEAAPSEEAAEKSEVQMARVADSEAETKEN